MSARYATKIDTRMTPSTITNQPVLLIGSQLVISTGVTLKSTIAKPIATANAKNSAPRESSVSTSAGSAPFSPAGCSSCAA